MSRHINVHAYDISLRIIQIASRLEVFVSPPGAPLGVDGAAAWRRLGFLSLDPNEQSGHQVDTAKRFSRFLFTKHCTSRHHQLQT